MNTDETKETSRIEAFSDGVFAIAITLLVLDLKVVKPSELPPGMSLGVHLANQWPSFVAYLGSFITILIMWASHHRLFTAIRRTDTGFLFLNGLLLLVVSVVPFPTALLSAHLLHPGASTAAALYSGNFVLIALAFNALWRYAAWRNRLLSADVSPALVRGVNRLYLFGPPLYLTAFALAFFHPMGSLALCLSLALVFALTGQIIRKMGNKD